MRASRATWDDAELGLLNYAMSLYAPRKVDYGAIAHLFKGRSVAEVRKRGIVLRDRARRLERAREAARWSKPAPDDEQSSLEATSRAALIPHDGKLHPELVWVPPEYSELETMQL